MVVDLKLFTPGKAIAPNTLWVFEEAPGKTASADLSRTLELGHWPSFNRPYFPEIYEAMGYPAIAAKYGDIFSYQLNPRANIFRRDAGAATTMQGVRELLMSNKWKSDPLSLGYPGNAIAGRFDFKGGPFPGSHESWFKLGLHGARDGKVISGAQNAAGIVSMDAINGPPITGDCPPFEFSGMWANVTHLGIPDRIAFPWKTYTLNADGTISY
jgi:hypothetical protein